MFNLYPPANVVGFKDFFLSIVNSLVVRNDVYFNEVQDFQNIQNLIKIERIGIVFLVSYLKIFYYFTFK